MEALCCAVGHRTCARPCFARSYSSQALQTSQLAQDLPAALWGPAVGGGGRGGHACQGLSRSHRSSQPLIISCLCLAQQPAGKRRWGAVGPREPAWSAADPLRAACPLWTTKRLLFLPSAMDIT